MTKQGLHKKYNVTKVDGPTDPDAQYFVLRLDTDPHARVAAQAYVVSVDIDNPQLAKDIMVWLDELEERDDDGPESD